MRIKTFGYIYQRDTLRFKTICFLAPLTIKVNMLVGNGVMCGAITQLIFERAAAILYHMDYFLFRKKFKHSENACLLHRKTQQDFQIGKADRTGCLQQLFSDKDTVGSGLNPFPV